MANDAPEIGFTEARFINARPDTSTAQAIGVIGDVVKEVKVDKFQGDLQESADRIREFSLASKSDIRFSSLRKDIIDTKLFSTFQKALVQNKSTEAAALISAEAEVKRLINKNPGFAPEIRKLARDTLGLDPLGSKFKMDIADPSTTDPLSKTELGKRFLNTKTFAAQQGLSEEDTQVLLNRESRIWNLERQADEQDLREKGGEKTVRLSFQKTMTSVDKWLEDFQATSALKLRGKDQKFFDDNIKGELLQEIQLQKRINRQSFIESLTNADIGLDDASRSEKLKQFDRQFKEMEDWVGSKDFLATANRMNEISAAANELGLRTIMPVLSGLQDAFGDRAIDVFKLIDNPESSLHKILLELDPVTQIAPANAFVRLKDIFTKLSVNPGSITELEREVVTALYQEGSDRGSLGDENTKKMNDDFQKSGDTFPLKYYASRKGKTVTPEALEYVGAEESNTEDQVTKLFTMAKSRGFEVSIDDQGTFAFASKGDIPLETRALLEDPERAGLSVLGSRQELAAGVVVDNFLGPMLELSGRSSYNKVFKTGKQGYIKRIRDTIFELEREEIKAKTPPSKPEAKKEEAAPAPDFSQVDEGSIIQLNDGTVAIIKNGKLVEPTSEDLQLRG